ncbi:MAG: hypothetical protein WBA25_06510 [Jannaschia sp.]
MNVRNRALLAFDPDPLNPGSGAGDLTTIPTAEMSICTPCVALADGDEITMTSGRHPEAEATFALTGFPHGANGAGSRVENGIDPQLMRALEVQPDDVPSECPENGARVMRVACPVREGRKQSRGF